MLKRALFLSAFAALKCKDRNSRAYQDRKRAEGKKHNQAVITLARRRCNVLFAMLPDGHFTTRPKPSPPNPHPPNAKWSGSRCEPDHSTTPSGTSRNFSPNPTKPLTNQIGHPLEMAPPFRETTVLEKNCLFVQPP